MNIISTIQKVGCEAFDFLRRKVEEFKNWKWSDEVILIEPQTDNVVTFEILPTNFIMRHLHKTQLCKYAEELGGKARVIGNKVKFILPDTDSGRFSADFIRETWYEY